MHGQHPLGCDLPVEARYEHGSAGLLKCLQPAVSAGDEARPDIAGGRLLRAEHARHDALVLAGHVAEQIGHPPASARSGRGQLAIAQGTDVSAQQVQRLSVKPQFLTHPASPQRGRPPQPEPGRRPGELSPLSA
jgi:hypothetical protein